MSSRALPVSDARGGSLGRLLLVAASALLAGTMASNLADLMRAGLAAIRSPYGIDYGEGIVWQQMLSIAAGHGYAPLGTFPAIVFHYPPVYHTLVALLSHLTGIDGLATGRAVSLAATLATAVMFGLLARLLVRTQHGSGATLAAGLAALVYLGCWPVADWSALMRVDMLAGLFGAAGMLFALRSIDRPRQIHLASLCFVLAVFTKQVSIAAPAAAFLAIVAVRPRRAMLLAAECLALGGIALAALEVSTQGGFLRHIIFYNMNRNELGRLILLVQPMFVHGIYVLLALVGGWGASRRLRAAWTARRADPAAFAIPAALLLFLAFKTIMLAMIAKSGSAANYMIEWFGAVAVFAAAAAAPALAKAAAAYRGAPGTGAGIAAALIASLAFQAMLVTAKGGSAGARPASDAPQLAALVELIRETPRPIVSDEMTLILHAGKPVQWEPSITAELGSVGRYDQAGFVRMIAARRLGFFVTEGDRGDWLFDSRYNPPVAAAMALHYPVERVVAGLVLHLPPPGVDPALDRRAAALPGKN